MYILALNRRTNEVTIEELRKLLKEDIVTVTFTKKNGDKRVMLCTLLPNYLPGGDSGGLSTSVPSDTIVTVWDIEQNAWRSFKFDTITSIETEYFNYVV